VHLLF